MADKGVKSLQQKTAVKCMHRQFYSDKNLADIQRTSTVKNQRQEEAFTSGDKADKLTFPPVWALHSAPFSLLKRSLQNQLKKDNTCCQCFGAKPDKAFGILSMNHPVRAISHKLVTSKIFLLLMMLIVITDVVHTALPEEYQLHFMIFILVSLYITEMVLKMVAHGLILGKGSYFQEAWNVFDFLLLVLMVISIIFAEGYSGNDHLSDVLSTLEAIRMLRAFRVIKSLGEIRQFSLLVRTFFACIRGSVNILLILLYYLIIIAIIGNQLFKGKFKHRCVRNYPGALNSSWNNGSSGGNFGYNYTKWIYHVDHWEEPSDRNSRLCGNSSGSWQCSMGYTCLELAKLTNPDGESFDTFGNALFMALRITFLFDWNTVYQKMVQSCGPIHSIYFVLAKVFGSSVVTGCILGYVLINYKREEFKSCKVKAEQETCDSTRESAIKVSQSRKAQNCVPGSGENGIHPSTGPKDLGNTGIQLSKQKSKDMPEMGAEQVLDKINQDIDGKKTLRFAEVLWIRVRKFRSKVTVITEHWIFELIINILILINLIAIAIEPKLTAEILTIHNRIIKALAVMFCAEVSIKLLFQGSSFISRWNIFDSIIVAVSMVGVIKNKSYSALVVLRAFRLMKVFLHLKIWRPMNRLLSNMSDSAVIIINLFVVFLITVLMFAAICMKVFRPCSINQHGPSGWGVGELFQFLTTIYLVFSGDFTTPFYVCSGSSDFGSYRYYLSLVIILMIFIIGYLILINVCWSIVLSGYGNKLPWEDCQPLVCQQKHTGIWENISSLLKKAKEKMGLKKINEGDCDCKYLINGTAVSMTEINLEEQQLIISGGPQEIMNRSKNTFSTNRSSRGGRQTVPQGVLNRNQSANKDGSLDEPKQSPSDLNRNSAIGQNDPTVSPSEKPKTIKKADEAITRRLFDVVSSNEKFFNIMSEHSITDKRNRVHVLSATSKDDPKLSHENNEVKNVFLLESRKNPEILESIMTDNVIKTTYSAGNKRDVNSSQEGLQAVQGRTVSNSFHLAYSKEAPNLSTHIPPSINGFEGTEQQPISSLLFQTDIVTDEDALKTVGVNSMAHRQLNDIDKQLHVLALPSNWSVFRDAIHRLVNTKVFELVIIAFILISTAAHAADDIYLPFNTPLQKVVFYAKITTFTVFVIEMCLRLVSIGLINYIKDFWCLIDLVVICTSTADLALNQGVLRPRVLGSLKAIRCLRCLLPIRASARLHVFKATVSALTHAMPALLHILLLVCFSIFVFSILMVKLFGGTVPLCSSQTNHSAINNTAVSNGIQYLHDNKACSKSFGGFENLASTYIFLMGTIYDRLTESVVGAAVERETAWKYAWLLCIASFQFICVFLLKQSTGVIMDNLLAIKNDYDKLRYARSLMIDLHKGTLNVSPQKYAIEHDGPTERPTNEVRLAVYNLVCSDLFESCVIILIVVCFITVLLPLSILFSVYSQTCMKSLYALCY